jgi:hypothetical protein
MVHCYTHTSPLLVTQLKQELALQITPNVTHKESISLTLKVFNSQDQIFVFTYEPSAAVCYRELLLRTLINPWSDMWENAITVGSLLTQSRDPSLLLHHPSVYSCCLATNEVRRCDERLVTAWLGMEKTPLRLLLCNPGACFNVTVLAWRKYATLLPGVPFLPVVRFLPR